MILDTCLFAGEADMLELRLRTLASVVDHFAVVACTMTHQGEPADRDAIRFAFATAAAWIMPGSEERVTLHWVEPSRVLFTQGAVLERAPEERGPAGSPWFQHIERQHRDGVRRVALGVCRSNSDVVMVSDVDEIPDPMVVARMRHWPPDLQAQVLVLQQRFHSTALDLLHPHQPWLGTTVSLAGGCQPQLHRDWRGTIDGPEPLVYPIGHGGWHFSWFGTDKERQRKLETFSHPELLSSFDPVEGRSQSQHSNGEVLRQITVEESYSMDWPAPLLDGSMPLPEHWLTADQWRPQGA